MYNQTQTKSANNFAFAPICKTVILAVFSLLLLTAANLNVSGQSQPILFSTNRDGNFEIYRMSADGTNQQRLTNTPENEFSGEWSPDGTKILYSVRVSSTQHQILTMNADGSNKTVLIDATEALVTEGWSPNGEKILFSKRVSSSVQNLWVMNADGSNKTQLTNAGTVDHIADWSPDGSKIAFGRCPNAPSNFICDVWTMKADGSNQVSLIPNSPEDDEDSPQWTNDGNEIVFGFSAVDASGERFIAGNVQIINTDGTNRRTLTDATPTSSFFYNPERISPDGSKVAVRQRNRVSTTTAELFNSFEISTVGLDGNNLTNLTNNSVQDNFGAWSPDSSRIAFESKRDSSTDEIYVMNADGSGVVRLTNNTANDFVLDWYRPALINPRRAMFDFDGDGRTDYVVFRPTNGVWYLLNSTSGFTGAQFGLSTDQLAPADFDGDGRTDIAVFRNGIWYLLQSSAGFAQTQFGQAGDVPVPADFDGDGKADLAVYRDGANGGQSYFYYLGSLNNPNKNITFIPFGAGGDKPVVGDYDGDEKADPAVYRNGVWYLLRSQSGVTAVQFGIATDKPTPADFDGDGKTDLAVYRNGVWYILQSSDSQVKIIQFGISTDVPTVGDYDGDGKADLAVWRESNSVFYVLGSQSGFTAVQFGAGGDVPVASAYVP